MQIKALIISLVLTIALPVTIAQAQDINTLVDEKLKQSTEKLKKEQSTSDQKDTSSKNTVNTVNNDKNEKKQGEQPEKNTLKKKPINKNSTTSLKKKKQTPIKKLSKEESLKKKQEDLKKREETEAKNIEKVLNYGINKQRKEAIIRILKIKDKDLRKKLGLALIEVLKVESDIGVKIKAISVLGELKEKDAIPLFISKLDDPSSDVKIQAAYGLKQLDAVSSQKKLVEELKKQEFSENSNYTEALLTTLGYFKTKEIIPFVQEKITSSKTSKTLRGYLVLFLGKTGSKEPKDFLIKLFKDDDEDKTIRAYAVNALGKLGITETAKDIKDLLNQIDSYPLNKKKNYYNLQMYSIAALAKMGDQDATPRLINSLKSDNASVRLRAARLLKELKAKSAIDILIYKTKYDPNAKVRTAAEKALKEMGIDKDGKPIKNEDSDLNKDNKDNTIPSKDKKNTKKNKKVHDKNDLNINKKTDDKIKVDSK